MALLLATLIMVAGCGQKPHVRASDVTTSSPLPVECEGDELHCDVLTSYRGVNVIQSAWRIPLVNAHRPDTSIPASVRVAAPVGAKLPAKLGTPPAKKCALQQSAAPPHR